TGKTSKLIGVPGNYERIDVSPDGRQLAVDTIVDGNRDIWVIDLDRNIPRRLTFDPAIDRAPEFAADGSRVFFSSTRVEANNPTYKLYQRFSNGTGADELLFSEPSAAVFAESASADGRHLIFTRTRGGVFNIWVLPLFGDKKPFLFRENAGASQLSPD